MFLYFHPLFTNLGDSLPDRLGQHASNGEEQMNRTILERIAMLLDELRRRGVPEDVMKPIINWLMDQKPR